MAITFKKMAPKPVPPAGPIPQGRQCKITTRSLWQSCRGWKVVVTDSAHPHYGVRFEDGTTGRCMREELEPCS